MFLIQVLAGKRLIANFPEVSAAHRCVRRTSDRPRLLMQGNMGIFSNIIYNIISASVTKWRLED